MQFLKLFSKHFLIIGISIWLAACGGSSDDSDDDSGADTDPVVLDFVLALFTTNGADWNDYLAGSDFASATDAACDAGTDPACIHGGEVRVVEATGKASCNGLTASDELGAFNWTCDDSTGTARMISTGLANGMYLSDLVDFTAAAFKANRVTVFDNGAVWNVTPDSIWWNNPLENLNLSGAGPTLMSSGTIYIATINSIENFILGADKISLVIEPGVTLSGPALGLGSFVVQASDQKHIWLEGDIDAAGDESGARLVNVNYSVLRNLTSRNATQDPNRPGIFLENSHGNHLIDVNVGNNSVGIELRGGSSNNTVVNLMASNNDNGGIYLLNATGNNFNNITSNDHVTGEGITILGSSNNTFEDATFNGSFNGGIVSKSSSNNSFMNVTANDNFTGGIILTGSSNNTFDNVTANNSINRGILLQVEVPFGGGNDIYSDGNSFTGVTATGNNVGIQLNDSSDNTFAGLNVTGNTTTNCLVDPPSGTDGGRLPGDPGLDNNCIPSP